MNCSPGQVVQVRGRPALTGPGQSGRRGVTNAVNGRPAAAGELAARGVDRVDCRDDHQVSLVGVPLPDGTQPNVWVEPDRFLSFDIDGGHVRRPIADLHDVAEYLIRRIEEGRGERPYRAP